MLQLQLCYGSPQSKQPHLVLLGAQVIILTLYSSDLFRLNKKMAVDGASEIFFSAASLGRYWILSRIKNQVSLQFKFLTLALASRGRKIFCKWNFPDYYWSSWKSYDQQIQQSNSNPDKFPRAKSKLCLHSKFHVGNTTLSIHPNCVTKIGFIKNLFNLAWDNLSPSDCRWQNSSIKKWRFKLKGCSWWVNVLWSKNISISIIATSLSSHSNPTYELSIIGWF